MKTDYNNPPIGCYFDGALGQNHNDFRVIKLALSYGWQDNDATELVACDEMTDNQWDILSDVAQDAEDYLNSLETRPFVSWQWHDGDFGLYPDVETAREECEFVSSRKQEYPDDNYEGEWLHVNDHGNCTLYVRESGEDKEIWSLV